MMSIDKILMTRRGVILFLMLAISYFGKATNLVHLSLMELAHSQTPNDTCYNSFYGVGFSKEMNDIITICKDTLKVDARFLSNGRIKQRFFYNLPISDVIKKGNGVKKTLGFLNIPSLEYNYRLSYIFYTDYLGQYGDFSARVEVIVETLNRNNRVIGREWVDILYIRSN